ncbi:MAG: hypothetical protein C0603_02070 [Denitrovibrio sp.]|nr:MAG: hypothetical protein C0603_02070 [Denitrovibrio sp.]
MIKYFSGSIIVLIIAFIIVTYGVKKSGVTEQIETAMDVPIGEFDTMGIREAKVEADGYILYFDGLRLYESRDKVGTMCSTNLEIYFPKKKNATLVMKLRYNVGPFLAKPLRGMTAKEALIPDSQYKMISSLKEGYAKQYGIVNMDKVILKDFTCKENQ